MNQVCLKCGEFVDGRWALATVHRGRGEKCGGRLEPIFDDAVDAQDRDQVEPDRASGRIELIEAVNIAEAHEWAPWASIIIPVDGGFKAFEMLADYERFVKDNPV